MTSTLGAGLAPAGFSLFGFGTPASGQDRTRGLFITAEQAQGSANYIDPSRGDYQVDEFGRPLGWDSTSQRVYLALRTVQGTAVDLTLGLPAAPGVLSSSTLALLRTQVIQALQPLTSTRKISIVTLSVTAPGMNRARIDLTWRDLQTASTFSLSL